MKTVEEYTVEFLEDPEPALQALIREVCGHYPSRRNLSRVIEERMALRYPEEPVAAISVAFWLSWAFGLVGASARTPMLHNGVRLFRILLELKYANDRKNELLAVP